MITCKAKSQILSRSLKFEKCQDLRFCLTCYTKIKIALFSRSRAYLLDFVFFLGVWKIMFCKSGSPTNISMTFFTPLPQKAGLNILNQNFIKLFCMRYLGKVKKFKLIAILKKLGCTAHPFPWVKIMFKYYLGALTYSL